MLVRRLRLVRPDARCAGLYADSAPSDYVSCQRAKYSTTTLLLAGMALVIGIFALAFALVWLCNRNRKNGRADGKDGKGGRDDIETTSSSRRRPKDVEADAGRKDRSARGRRGDSNDERGEKDESDNDDSDDSDSSSDDDDDRHQSSKARSQQSAAASRKLQEEREATMRAQQAREAQERARQQPSRTADANTGQPVPKSKKSDESSSDESDSDDTSDGGDSDSDDSDNSSGLDSSSSDEGDSRKQTHHAASAGGRGGQSQPTGLNGSPVQTPKPTRQLYPANASPDYSDQHARPSQPQHRNGSTSSGRVGVPPAGPPPSGSLPRAPIPSAMRQSAYGGESSHRQSLASVRVGGSLPSGRAPPMPGMQSRPRMASEGGAGSTRPLKVRKSIASNHPGRTATEPMPRRPSQGQRTPVAVARTDDDLPPVPPLDAVDGEAAYGGGAAAVAAATDGPAQRAPAQVNQRSLASLAAT